MAIDRLYKLPDASAQNVTGVFTGAIVFLILVTLLVCWAATQFAAWKLGYQPSLGEPLIRLAGVALYMPFDFFIWLIKFGHVEETQSAWEGGQWILSSLFFLIVPAIWLATRRAKKHSGKTDLHGSAHWATREEIFDTGLIQRPESLTTKALKKFRLKKTKTAASGGCYVGAWVDPQTAEYKYLIHNGPEHILGFAPTRSGKGVGLVLPTLLSWPASALIHDIKGEAWALTAGYRRAKGGKALKFEPTAFDGSSIRFNPLSEIRLGTLREVADCQNIAQMIVDPDGKGMDDHWSKTGHELMSAAILHILYISRNLGLPQMATMRGLVSFFCDPKMTIDQVAESMLNSEHDPLSEHDWRDPITNRKVKVHPVIAESARSFLNKSENERSGVQSTAMSFLSLYRDPVVAMNTAVSEFNCRDLMNHESPCSLYLVVPPTDQARLKPLMRLMIALIMARNTEKMDFADGRSVAGYKHRLLFLLDEFPALGKMEIIESSMAFLAGYGIKCYLITQDISQLQKIYSKDESIMSNCHVRIAFAPNNIETAKVKSEYLGTATIMREQRSYSGSRLSPFMANQNSSQQETGRKLLTPDEVLRLPGPIKNHDGSKILEPGDMLILVAGASPIYGKQILYFKDPIFDGRSKIKAPRQSDRLMKVEKFELPEDQPEAIIEQTPKSPPIEPVATVAAVAVYTAEEVAKLDAEAEVEAAMLAEDVATSPNAGVPPDDLDFKF